MKRTCTILLFFLFCLCEASFGYGVVTTRKLMLENKVRQLDEQINTTKDEASKKSLVIQRDALRKELDKIIAAEEKETAKSTSDFSELDDFMAPIKMSASLKEKYNADKVSYQTKDDYSWYEITVGEKMGACGSDGKEIIAPKYSMVTGEVAGNWLCFECTDPTYTKKCIYRADGKVILPCDEYEYVSISGPYIIIEKKSPETKTKTCSVRDTDGKTIISPGKYDFIGYHKKGNYFSVQKFVNHVAKCGVCDISGKEIIPCLFYWAGYSSKYKRIMVAEDSENVMTYQEYLTSREGNGLASSSRSSSAKPLKNTLKNDEQIVKNYINQGNSSEALGYLKEVLKSNYPSDADTQFGYATLIQDIIVGLGKEGLGAVASMNLAASMSNTFNTNEANTLQVQLLALAASKGHEGAKLMLQLKSAMAGNGNINYNNNNVPINNSNNSGSSVTQSRCSLCGGKGWIAGSKTPTYGNMGTYWCDECRREVPQSHSHDRCPSCGGKGYTTGIR